MLGTPGSVADEPRRALVLAGGGIRVAWQAGVVQALDEAGLTFDHGDGTSGGIFTLGMLMSGVSPERARAALAVAAGAAVRLAAPAAQLRPAARRTGRPSAEPAGVRDRRASRTSASTSPRSAPAPGMTGTFNVADFDSKICVAIPHDEIDLDRMIAGVSLPIFLPAVQSGGRTWTDAVWIKDANLLEAVRRGCTELWLVWCIGNTPAVGQRSARAVRAHDRAVGQRRAVRRAGPDRRHQRPSGER